MGFAPGRVDLLALRVALLCWWDPTPPRAAGFCWSRPPPPCPLMSPSPAPRCPGLGLRWGARGRGVGGVGAAFGKYEFLHSLRNGQFTGKRTGSVLAAKQSCGTDLERAEMKAPLKLLLELHGQQLFFLQSMKQTFKTCQPSEFLIRMKKKKLLESCRRCCGDNGLFRTGPSFPRRPLALSPSPSERRSRGWGTSQRCPCACCPLSPHSPRR